MGRFDQHSHAAADQLAEIAAAKLPLERGQPGRPIGLLGRMNLIGHLGRGRSPPRAEGKDVDFGKADFFGHLAGRQKIVFALARKTDDDVGRQRRQVERLADQSAAVDIAPASPAALHAAQHRDRNRSASKCASGDRSAGDGQPTPRPVRA